MNHSQAHSHGHTDDQGLAAMLRYARQARSMWRSPINDAVVAQVAPATGETVVDIGAGVGAGTMVAAHSGATVLAIEPTPYLRRVLRARRWGQRSRSRIHVVGGTAEATGVDTDTVDAAWAVNTMHHWIDPAAAAHELARILRPGGRLILVDEDFEDPTHPDHEAFTDRHRGHHGFRMVDLEAIVDHLDAAGLHAHGAATRLAGVPTLTIGATRPLADEDPDDAEQPDGAV